MNDGKRIQKFEKIKKFKKIEKTFKKGVDNL